MSNELHVLESVPRGFAAAFDGEWIKKSCETCGYYYDYQEYSHHDIGCNFNDGDNPMQNLRNFPFKNGCKHFDLHHAYTVDWDAEARRMDEEHAVCQHLSNGKCFCYSDCENKRHVERESYPTCEKWERAALTKRAERGTME